MGYGFLADHFVLVFRCNGCPYSPLLFQVAVRGASFKRSQILSTCAESNQAENMCTDDNDGHARGDRVGLVKRFLGRDVSLQPSRARGSHVMLTKSVRPLAALRQELVERFRTRYWRDGDLQRPPFGALGSKK
eukprot:1545536-Prymnesium_polylepis.3